MLFAKIIKIGQCFTELFNKNQAFPLIMNHRVDPLHTNDRQTNRQTPRSTGPDLQAYSLTIGPKTA